jgi:elongation factor 1-alpha
MQRDHLSTGKLKIVFSVYMTDSSEKKHLGVVICGHVDSGKSTTTGRLIYDLGGIPEREMEKLRDEAKLQNKESFAFAFYMDRQKEERARGVTIACTTKQFFTDRYHYTIIDAPGHRDFIKNMITGASQADVAIIMVPADGNFTAAIAKGNHKAGEVMGQTRQHARLINLLGIKQVIVGINKMDTATAGYKKERYEEVHDEMVNIIASNMSGKRSDAQKKVRETIPMIPISGLQGENLLKKSDKMPWWTGVDVKGVNGETMHVETLLDALNNYVCMPPRNTDAPLRIPISGLLKIKGVGDVLTGRVEQGVVKPGEEVKFIPTNTKTNACTGKVFSIEMHHTTVPQAGPGDNVGLNIKALNKDNMPRSGDILILKNDTSLDTVGNFTVQVQVMEHPGELKVGYTPIVYVRTNHVAARMTKINWKVGKETGGKKVEDPPYLKAGDMAEVVFEPMQGFVVDTFNNCEGLARVAIMEGHSAVMIGKCVGVTHRQ